MKAGEINLMSGDAVFLFRWTARRMVVLSCVLAAVGMAVVHSIQAGLLDSRMKALNGDQLVLADMEARRDQAANTLSGIGEIAGDLPDLKPEIQVARLYMKGRISWSRVIGEIIEASGGDMWLDGMRALEAVRGSGKEKSRYLQLKLDGWSLSPDGFVRLIASMEDNPLFSGVVLSSCASEEHGGRRCYRFTIECEVAG